MVIILHFVWTLRAIFLFIYFVLKAIFPFLYFICFMRLGGWGLAIFLSMYFVLKVIFLFFYFKYFMILWKFFNIQTILIQPNHILHLSSIIGCFIVLWIDLFHLVIFLEKYSFDFYQKFHWDLIQFHYKQCYS